METDYTLTFILFVTLPTFVFSCKSRAQDPDSPLCPEGYWEVPEGWQAFAGYKSDGFWNDKCMKYAYLCDGERSLIKAQYHNKYHNYPDGSPDENNCTDEFCASLTDGRTKRCPGTTRCITPTVDYFEGTDIPIGPICAEVRDFETMNFLDTPYNFNNKNQNCK